MDQGIRNFIRKHSGKPLAELKLELMKQGFSSYQIEQALKEVRLKRRKTFKTFAFLALIIIILIIIGLVFYSFIKPAQEFVSVPEKEKIILESEKPETQLIEETREIITEPGKIQEKIKLPLISDAKKEILSKVLEEIRELSNDNPLEAISECEKIDDKEICFNLVAKNTNNIKTCDKITDLEIKDDCLFFFGQSDKEVCNQISSSSLKSSCEMLADIDERV